MNLYAYSQIEDLDAIAKANGIEVPRLRGYLLMANEDKMDYEKMIEDMDVQCTEDLCVAEPTWNPKAHVSSYDEWTDYLTKYYCHDNKVRWDRIHGWKRRVLKTYIHNEKQKCKKQAEIFNKYVGRKDILYIHARIGGGNWSYYHDKVDKQPWFIEKIDDAFDSTYCDIYAKIMN